VLALEPPAGPGDIGAQSVALRRQRRTDDGLDGHAQSRRRDLGRLPLERHAAHELGSTMRRQWGILVDVPSVLP